MAGTAGINQSKWRTAASFTTMSEKSDKQSADSVDTAKDEKAIDDDFAKKSDVELALQHDNLYDEVHAKLLSAFLMFCLPDLRAMAKQGLLQGDSERIERIVDLPATLEDILTVYDENMELLTRERLKDKERAQMYKDALSLQRYELDDATKKSAFRQVLVVHFQDEHEEEECVYAIALNHVHKEINIAFRGSVTNKDFRQDVKAIMGSIPNPVKVDGLPDTVGVHLGFREYLYNEEKLSKVLYVPRLSRDARNETKNLPEGQMKYQIILSQVKELLKDRPDYKVYITGHSLGGALATLLAFSAGASDELPKPVTCITSGAPKVGNIAFLHCFEELEKQQKLRCVQVANDRDAVTLSPQDAFVPCWAMCCQNRRYRHVGLRVTLKGKGYNISYPMKMQTYCGILLCDLMNISQFWIAVVCLGIAAMFCFTACSLIAVPTAAICCCRAMKTSRQHHTQLKYVRRLEYNQESMQEFDIDVLNEERFARSRWKVPVLFEKKSGNCCSRRWEDAAEDSMRTNGERKDEQPAA